MPNNFTKTKFYNDVVPPHQDMCDNVSEMLVRANPKLSTNVKLMTNGDFVMLESFNACKETSVSKYKNVRTYSDSRYNQDISRFWNKLDTSLSYSILQEYDNFSVKDSYDQQYETFYWSGCEYIDSLEYDEPYGILAPLWLDDIIPERFVVFRITDPSYWNFVDHKNEATLELDFEHDILDKCEIVKTFDLTEKTKIGSYIRRYYSQDNFPEAPLTLDKEYLSFNGIDYNTGNFTSAKEYYGERFWRHDDNVLEFDKYITEGFERNGIIVANILNLEFLFDDEKAKDYEFARYFGLYCNILKDGTFAVTKNNLHDKANTYKFDVFEFDCYHDRPFIAKNENGVNLPKTEVETADAAFEPTYQRVSSMLGMFCIEDKHEQLHLVSRTQDLEQFSTYAVADAYKLCEKEVDFKKFNGFVLDIDSIDCVYEDNTTKSSLACKVLAEMPQYTRLELYKNDMLQGYIIANNACQGFINHGEWEYDMFCGEGSPADIAKSIAGSFNSIFDIGIKAYYSADSVYFISMNSSPAYNEYELRVSDQTEDYLEMSNNGRFFGSNPYDHVKCKADKLNSFKIGNYLPTRTKEKYAKIIAVVPDYDSTTIINGNQIVFGDDKYYDVLLDGPGVIVSRTNQVSTYKEFRPSFGRLSFFPVRDLEMSTCHDITKYGDKTELDYELEQLKDSIQLNVTNIVIAGNEMTITIDDPNLGQTNIVVTLDLDDSLHLENYTFDISFSNDEYTITVNPNIANNNNINADDVNVIPGNFNFDTLSTTLNVPILTYLLSEYDRCHENLNPEYMTLSKTQPWVCNWVMKNSLDIREKPYRLNSNPVFGQYSFTPDVTSHQPNPVFYNQEWTYLMEEPVTQLSNMDVDQRKIWSYIGCTITDKDEFEDNLRSTIQNWFDTYFKRDHICIGNDFYTTPDYMHKYSILRNGSTNANAETFFRGAKIEFIMKSDWTEKIDNNLNDIKKKFGNDLNGYKFTAVCVPISISDASAIDDNVIKVIRNDVFKTITLIIYIVKKYDDAVEHVFGLANQDATTMDIGAINRYKLYNYASNKDNASTQLISIKGKGEVKTTQDSGLKFTITGENTSFLTDFTIYKTGEYSQEIFLIQNFNLIGTQYSSAVQMLPARIDEIVSDTEMKATVIPSPSDSIYAMAHLNCPNSVLHTQYPVGNDSASWSYFIMNCDYEHFSENLSKNVFGTIFYTVNTTQKDMVYEMVYKDNNAQDVLLSSENGEYPFAMRFIKPMENAKYEYMSLLYDGEFITQAILPNHASPMYRHTGLFTPLKNDVLYFTDPYIEEAARQPNPFQADKKLLFETSRHMNTCFDLEMPGFGIIKDLAFHRANENNSNVFKLTDTQKPVYPTSNRFAIGKRDIQTFISSWDPWYFTRTLSNTLETDCHGTLSMKENKSFFGSKCLSVPERFIFDIFTFAELDTTKKQQEDVLYSIKSSNVELYVNIEQVLAKKLVQDLTPLFEEYIDSKYSYGDTSTVLDDVEKYVKLNLLKLYQIADIKLCIKEESNPEREFDFNGLKMTANQKESNRLRMSKVMGISSIRGNNFNKKIVMNTRSGVKYTLGLRVEITKK